MIAGATENRASRVVSKYIKVMTIKRYYMSYPNHVRKDGYVDVNTSVTIFMFQCFIGCVVQNLQHLEACPCGYIYLVIIAAGCSRVHLQNWLD